MYSQTCIKKSPLGLIKRWPFKTGDCLIEVTTWTAVTVYIDGKLKTFFLIGLEIYLKNNVY
jgi:hypothetical protein